jgi:trimeric autotransporter adhesin
MLDQGWVVEPKCGRFFGQFNFFNVKSCSLTRSFFFVIAAALRLRLNARVLLAMVAAGLALPAGSTLFAQQVTTLAGSGQFGSTDATGAAASFNGPAGAAVGADGTVYVTEFFGHKIRKITAAGVVTTLAGSGQISSTDGTGTAASFANPFGVAVGADGTVYVADYRANKIRKITAAGVVTTLAGTLFGASIDGVGVNASFDRPAGVAVGPDGALYVTDSGAHKIRKITMSGGVATVSTLAGSGTPGSTDGTGTAARFNTPTGVAVGADGAVYVADNSSNKIRKITMSGGVATVSTLAGSGQYGSTDGPGASASFSSPEGVAVGADGAVYVMDSRSNKIRKITISGGVATVSTLAGSGQADSTDGTGTAARFNVPVGVAVGADGALYVADYGSNKIRKITFGDPTTTVLTASAATVTSGATVTLTATVTHQPPTGSAVTPTGTVTFQSGTTTLGTGTLNGSGVATLAVDSATLAEGSSNLTAGYGGRSGGTQPNLAVSTSTAVALTVNRAPTLPGTVTTTAFTPGTAGSFQFTATGVPAPTFTTASTLPSGVTLSSSGLLAGTAAAGTGGNYPITLSASNGIGGPATRSFTLVVTSPPVFSGSSTLNAVAGSPVSVLVGAAGFPAETNSNLITNDFSAATLPTGWTTSGVAAVTGGILQLTPASNNSRGIVTLPAVGATSPTGFSARFKLIVSNAGGADGLSFNYGALLTGTTLTGTASLETGMVSAGLVVTFGEFGDDRMEVRYNNKILSQVYVPFASAAGKPVDVTVTPLGLLTLTVDGVTITTVNLGADYVAAAKSTWQFAFAARTGGSNSQHAIDDLTIDALQIAYGTTANFVESTFGAALPTGWNLFGNASLDTANNELILTPNAGNRVGAFVLPALGAATPTAFSAQFDYRAADGSGADGTSFNYGVIPASPTGSDQGIATAGLVVQMTEFGTDRILIKYDGTTLQTGNVNLSGPFRRVSIDVAADGAIAVSVNGTVAVSATLPAGYLSATKTAWQFAFGSRTGGSTNKHSLRNLSIARPRSLPAGLALDPVTGRISGTLTNSATANYPLTLVATNAFGTTVREATLANGPLSNLSATFAAGADIGLSRGFFTESGVTLGSITLGFAPRPGQKLTLLENTGAAASTGRFTGIAEGGTVTAMYNGDTFTFALSYVGGTGNDVVLTRVFGPGQIEGDANVTTFAGTSGAKGSTDGTGAAARFNYPRGVVVGADGTVYVGDTFNHTIRKMTSAGVVTTLAGSVGSNGLVNGQGTAAKFNYPIGVAIGGDGAVYVADFSNALIRKISTGGVVSTLAGAGFAGNVNATGTAASFNCPTGIAVAADGTVYVADSFNHKIRKITAAGVVTTLAGSGVAGRADGTGAVATFNNPEGVAVGADGTVYVADSRSNTIRKITAAGVVTTLAGSGSTGSANATGTAASFNYPTGIAVAADGTVYVADRDNMRIRKITAAGVVTTLAGSGSYGGTDGLGAAASFAFPYGVAVGVDGTVYVADNNNHTIRKITAGDARPIVTTTAATAVTGGGATLNGTINPNGFSTTARFEYGLTDTYGTTAALTLSPTNGTTAQTVSAALTGLTAGTTYYYRLTATNVDGTAATTAGTFTTTAVTVPRFNGSGSGATTATSFLVSGSISSDGGLPITERGAKYRVAGSTGAYSSVTTSGTTGTFSVTITGLTSGTTYEFYPYAVNGAGEGKLSGSRPVTTLRLTASASAPTGLTADVSGTSARLSFTPGDNGGVSISNYEVSFDNGSTWQAMSPATTASPLTITGLTPGVTYQVKVRAVTSVGSGAASSAVAVTAPVTLAITSAVSASGTYGTAFSYQVAGDGAPTTFSATGLPAGLSINPSTGAITGTPTQTGSFTADLTIGKANSTATAKRALEITIAKKALTVTAEAKSRGFGQRDPAFTAILSGFVGSDTAALVSGAPKFSVAATESSVPGTYAITPTAGSLSATNYSFGTFTPANLTITARAATVTLGDLAQAYTGATRPVKVTTTPAGLSVTLSYAGTGATTYAASATAPTDAGSYTVTATVNDGSYSGTTTQTLVVAKASQTITIAPLPTSVALNTLATVNIAATASSGLPVTFGLDTGSAAGVGLSAVVSPSTLTSLGGSTGTVKLIATQAGNANYDAASTASADFEVTKANQTITFTGPSDQAFNAASPTVSLVATTDATGLPVSFAVVSGNATVSGSTLTLAGTGKVVVRASQAGDGTYNAAPSVDRAFTVGRTSQTVTFNALSNATYGDPAITLSATTTPTGRTVTFELISGPATISGGTTLTLTGAGEVKVQASQAGDADYAAATPVVRTFTVAPKGLTVTGTTAQNKTYDGTNTATVTGATLVGVVTGDSVSLGGATAGTFSQTGAGNSLVVTTALTLVGADAANYTLAQPTSLTANITKKTLKVGGVTVADKIYDGLLTASASYSAATVVGLVGSDVVTLDSAAATAAFADKTAAANKTVTITGLALAAGGASANYTLVQPTGEATIQRKTLLVSGATASNRDYNGTRTATVSYSAATLSGKVGSDVVNIDSTSATALFDDRKVGAERSVQVAGLALSGNDSANYSLGQPTLSASINPKTITVTGVTGVNKVFDRQTNATVVTSGAVLVGVETADVAAVSLVATDVLAEFADAEVGTNKPVAIGGLTLTGAESTNYTLTQPSATASITGPALTVTGIVGFDKAYDGTTEARVGTTAATLVGVTAGSGVSLDVTNVTATFANATVGTNKTVQVAGLVLSGPNAANYSLTQPTTTATISPVVASVSGVTVDHKSYDGTLTARASYTGLQLTGILTGETVTAVTTGASASFADKAVASGKPVTLTGITLTGAQAANYTLSLPTLSADITPKPITVTGITVASRVYDTTALLSPSFSGAALVGVVQGDTVALDSSGAVAAMADGLVGLNKPVTFTGVGLSGADAGNYSLTQPTATATITPQALTVTGVTASNKIYNGNTVAAADFSNVALVGVIAGDTVTPVSSAATANFSSKTVAAGKTVTIAGLTLAGSEAPNYTVTQPTTTANIIPKNLTVNGVTAANKVYDRTLAATLNFANAALVGVVSGDTVTPASASTTGTFATVGVATAKTVSVAGLALSGADAANYTVTQPTTTADITAKNLTVIGVTAATKIFDNSTTATLAFGSAALVGIISPDDVILLTGAATGTFADVNTGRNKAVTIAGLALSGTDSANYSLTQPSATADSATAEASLTISNLAYVYNGTPRAVTVTVTPAGVPFTVVYPTTGGGAPTDAGSYAVTATVTDPNYSGTATQTLVIAKATQTLTLNAPASATILTPVAVSATASSNLPVTLAVTGPATLAGGQLTFTAPGTATVTATQPGNENYAAATATATITSAGKLSQTIAFTPVSDRLSNSGTFALSATASSGLPVSFTVTSGPALLSGADITLTGVPGTVVILASQPGNAVYNAAPDVAVTFSVTAAKTNVYFGTVTSAGSTAKTGDIAAVMPPDTNKGSLLVVAPSVGVNSAFDFTLNPNGTFTITYVVPGDVLTTPIGTPAIAAAPVTLTIRGTLVNGRLQGVIEPLGVTFSAVVLPVTGASANAAGFYQSSNLATAGGETYSVVGTNNEVLVLATAPGVTTGGLATLGSNGSFSLQTQTSAGVITVRGSVDAPTTTVSGTISVPGKADTNFAGVATTTKRTDRLIGLATRAKVGIGESVLIAGVAIGGTESKRVLIRAGGPALAGFGLTNTLTNPTLKIYRGSTLIAQNDDWSPADAAETARLGLFAFPNGSKDAAILTTLEPGTYTAQVSDLSGTGTGVALAEIYDASVNPTAEYQRLVSIASRGTVSLGDGALIGGFVVVGNAPKTLLIRGIGPTLTRFGIVGALADPVLTIYDGGEALATNAGWANSAAIATAATEAGAFALATGSRDAALLVTLKPGSYTAQVKAAQVTSSGVALIEIYEVP